MLLGCYISPRLKKTKLCKAHFFTDKKGVKREILKETANKTEFLQLFTKETQRLTVSYMEK